MDTKKRIEPVYDFRRKVKNDTDLGTVSIRIYSNSRQQYLSTGVRIRRTEWSPTQWVIRRKDATKLNERIRQSIKEAQSACGRVCPLRQSSAPFLDWMSDEIDKLTLTPDTIYRHKLMLQELESYGKIRTFRDVTAEKITEYLHFIAQRKTARVVDDAIVTQPIKQVSIYAYYRRLSKWIRLAMSQDLLPFNALAGLKVPRGEYAQREHLTRSELKKWLACKPVYAPLVRARDLFAMQCATGLAFVDLMEADFTRLEKSGKFYTLSGRRHKTGKAYFSVMLPFGKEVLDRYDGQLPKLSNQRYNYYLKQVAGMCGLTKRITTHVGRHTYACLCLSAGVRMEAVQRTLGHADIKTTQIYAQLVDSDVVASFEKAEL